MRGKRNRQILTVVVAVLAVVIVGFLAIGLILPNSWPGQMLRGTGVQTDAKEPIYGMATVDGDYSEWDLATDWFADMYRAGNPNKPVETKLYLRYDCTDGIMYVLLLSAGNWPILVEDNEEVWIKLGGSKVTFDEFAWVNQGYDGDSGHAQGWEAVFSIGDGNYNLQAHTNSWNDGESQTSDTTEIGLLVDCADIASIGDLVWFDDNQDGVQDAGEAGVENVTVNLYDENGQLVGTMKTNKKGKYKFSNLPPGQYQVEFVPPPAYEVSPKDAGDDALDSDGDIATGLAEVTSLDAGEHDPTWDDGLHQAPTAVELVRFEAQTADGAILLEWETASEIDSLGFNLYRSDAADGAYAQVSGELIASQAPGSPVGTVYSWLDETVEPGMTYFYRLEEIDTSGQASQYGPVSAVAGIIGTEEQPSPGPSEVNHIIFLPLVRR